MSRSQKSWVGKNVAANILGQAGVTCLALFFAPICIKQLGADGYGLVGLYGVVYTWLSVFDFGINSAVARESALSNSEKANAEALNGLLQIGESIYLCATALLLGLVYIFSDLIINSNNYPPEMKRVVVMLMAISAGLKLLEMMYGAVIKGVQEQVWFNVYNIITNVLRWGGASILLMYFGADAKTLFIWIGFCALISFVVIKYKVRHMVALKRSGYIDALKSLKSNQRFLIGSFSIALVSFFVAQSDKIVVNKTYGLAQFGYYSIAVTCASGLYVLVSSINSAVYPRLVQITVDSKSDSESIWREYFKYSKKLSYVIIVAAMLLSVFAYQILYAWTGSDEVSNNAARFLQVLSIAVMFHGLSFIPYSMQLSRGWTDIALKTSLLVGGGYVLSLGAIPMLGYGAVEVAYAFLAMNLLSFLLGLKLMHSRIFVGKMLLYIKEVVIIPLLIFGIPCFVLSQAISL